MNVQKKINEYTTLNYVEDIFTDDDENGEPIVIKYLLSFQFYDCIYLVDINREDIDNNNSNLCCLEGPGRLFESFEEACEEELWDTIKFYCNKYDEWYKQLIA